MNISKSAKLFLEAKKVLVGGVNSPARSFASVAGDPLIIDHAKGQYIWDVDGNRYIDFVCSWGPLILGASHPAILKAIRQALASGTSFGAPTVRETRLAQLIREATPSMELLRFVNSGTEATMSAIRLARGFTRRPKIMKFEGCYHGHADCLLVKAGSGIATYGLLHPAGVPEQIASQTLVLPYNDITAVREIFEAHPDSIAAVIVEPVAGNMGVVPPKDGFLEGLREVTKSFGALLIFDEIITAFRLGYGGAQSIFRVKPDLTCLGKIIGGGLPVGAYGGRREIMELLAPLGPVYQAGTLSGNPLSMAAGIATLLQLRKSRVYERLERSARELETGLIESAENEGIQIRINRAGSMMAIFFTSTPVVDFTTAQAADRTRYTVFFWSMLHQGVYIPCSPLEAMFISAAHRQADVAYTIKASQRAFEKIAGAASS